jgi:TM2 domain-containing membrane protein YozV
MDSILLSIEKTYYYEKSDSIKAHILLNKISYLLENQVLNQPLVQEINRIDVTYLDTTEQTKFYQNAALINYYNDNLSDARFYISNYQTIHPDTSANCLLFMYLIEKNFNKDSAEKIKNLLTTKDSSFKGLRLLDTASTYKRKGKIAYQIASALIPGSGTMLQGKVGRGVTSLLLNATSVISAYYLIQGKLYLSTLGYGLSLGAKFYIGNIKLTGFVFDNKEVETKNGLSKKYAEPVLNNLLDKYPFGLR